MFSLGARDAFFEIRQFKLTEDPRYIGTQEERDLWEANATPFPGAEFQTTVKFNKILPSHIAGDVVYAVHRSDWEVLLYEGHPRIGRIKQAKEIGANRWEYSVQPIRFTRRDGNFCPELMDESLGTAYNLSEMENLETGLLGNGINLTGWVEEGEVGENRTPKHFLAPVPNGTLVFYYTLSLKPETVDSEGTSENEGETESDEPAETEDEINRDNDHIMIFQFSNQLKNPFISHFTKEIPFPITGPSDSTEENSNNISMRIGGVVEKVYCPLLKDGETLRQGTKVVLSRNIITGKWEIIEAQCDSASAAALPGEGEGEDDGADSEFQDDPAIADEPTADNPEDEE